MTKQGGQSGQTVKCLVTKIDFPFGLAQGKLILNAAAVDNCGAALWRNFSARGSYEGTKKKHSMSVQ